MERMSFGSKLSMARKEKGLSQEQLAVRLGVTPQAVSKWERGSSYPDLELLAGLCDIIECSGDFLLSRDTAKTRLTEDRNEKTAERLLSKAIAEPIVMDVGMGLLELLTEENQNQFPGIRALREKLATEYGFLLPVVHIKDCSEINNLSYRVLIYDSEVYSKTLKEPDDITFQGMCEELEAVVKQNFGRIIHRQMIQDLIDHLAEHYPAVVKGVIPEKISPARLQAVLTGLLQQGKPIRKLIKILEIMEEEAEKRLSPEEMTRIIIEKLEL